MIKRRDDFPEFGEIGTRRLQWRAPGLVDGRSPGHELGGLPHALCLRTAAVGSVGGAGSSPLVA
jgi:hypothetical protein